MGKRAPCCALSLLRRLEAMNTYLQDGTPYEVSAIKEMVSKLTTDHTSMEAGGRETRSFDEARVPRLLHCTW